MATDEMPRLPADWQRELTAQVVTPLEAGRAESIASLATTAVGGAAASAITALTVAKVATAVVVTVTAGGLIAAAVGILPDPLQTWVADLVDGLGISLPRPDELVPDISTTIPTLPTVTVPDVTLPDITLPSVPLP